MCFNLFFKKYNCKACDFHTKNKYELENHFMTYHQDVIRDFFKYKRNDYEDLDVL
jgi:hypothetical protein